MHDVYLFVLKNKKIDIMHIFGEFFHNTEQKYFQEYFIKIKKDEFEKVRETPYIWETEQKRIYLGKLMSTQGEYVYV